LILFSRLLTAAAIRVTSAKVKSAQNGLIGRCRQITSSSAAVGRAISSSSLRPSSESIIMTYHGFCVRYRRHERCNTQSIEPRSPTRRGVGSVNPKVFGKNISVAHIMLWRVLGQHALESGYFFTYIFNRPQLLAGKFNRNRLDWSDAAPCTQLTIPTLSSIQQKYG